LRSGILPRRETQGEQAQVTTIAIDKLTLKPRPGTLTAHWLKVFLTLDVFELSAVPAPDGKPRITLRIHLLDRIVSAEIAAKSLRKA
jgi:hypothetical protein